MNTTITSKDTGRTFARNAPRWIALLAFAALVLSVATLVYLRTSQPVTPTVSGAMSVDRSYDELESARFLRSRVLPSAKADHSYDTIEQIRATR